MQSFKPVDRIVADGASPGINYQALHAGAISTSGWRSFSCFVMLSEVSGTAPTVDVIIQHSADYDAATAGDSHWIDLKAFPRMHLSGTYSVDIPEGFSSWVRIVGKVGGTHPHFRMSVMLSPRE